MEPKIKERFNCLAQNLCFCNYYKTQWRCSSYSDAKDKGIINIDHAVYIETDAWNFIHYVLEDCI